MRAGGGGVPVSHAPGAGAMPDVNMAIRQLERDFRACQKEYASLMQRYEGWKAAMDEEDGQGAGRGSKPGITNAMRMTQQRQRISEQLRSVIVRMEAKVGLLYCASYIHVYNHS
jgi:hypothetical protein